MGENDILKGKENQWRLLDKLGEGYAGEVYLVESTSDSKIAVLKRPAHSSFSADVQRQAAQIEMEGKILKALQRTVFAAENCQAKPVTLLDTSRNGTEGSAGFFIVEEKAAGIDFQILQKISLGKIQSSQVSNSFSVQEQYLLVNIEQNGIPSLWLYRMVYALQGLLQQVHSHIVLSDGRKYFGIVWNDIKPDHIFWDPTRKTFTIIDWGNGQFLNKNGLSEDGAYSPEKDDAQFLEEIGKYLAYSAPEIFPEFQWPRFSNPEEASLKLRALASLVKVRLDLKEQEINDLHRKQLGVLSDSKPDLAQLEHLFRIQTKIQNLGDLPETDVGGFTDRLLLQGLVRNDPDQYSRALKLATSAPGFNHAKWRTLALLATTAYRPNGGKLRNRLADLLHLGLEEKWVELLWEVGAVSLHDPTSTWWRSISTAIRRMVPEIGDQKPPMQKLQEIFDTLADQDIMRNQARSRFYDRFKDEKKEELLEILNNWNLNIDPGVSPKGLEYPNISKIKQLLEPFQPEYSAFEQALRQPLANIIFASNAWKVMEFEQVRRVFRNILLWDPDWRRVIEYDEWLTGDSNNIGVRGWLDVIKAGPQTSGLKKESWQKFAIRTREFGKDLKIWLGEAPWLDHIIATLEEIEKNNKPRIEKIPSQDALPYLPWLEIPKKDISSSWQDVSKAVESFHRTLKSRNFGEAQESIMECGSWQRSYQQLLDCFKATSKRWEVLDRAKNKYNQISTDFPIEDTWRKETFKIFEKIYASRQALIQDGLETADSILASTPGVDDWVIASGLRNIYSSPGAKALRLIDAGQWKEAKKQLERWKQEKPDIFASELGSAPSPWSMLLEACTDACVAIDEWDLVKDRAQLNAILSTMSKQFESADGMLQKGRQALQQAKEESPDRLLSECKDFFHGRRELEDALSRVMRVTQDWKSWKYDGAGWEAARNWTVRLAYLDTLLLKREGQANEWKNQFSAADNTRKLNNRLNGQEILNRSSIPKEHPLYKWIKNYTLPRSFSQYLVPAISGLCVMCVLISFFVVERKIPQLANLLPSWLVATHTIEPTQQTVSPNASPTTIPPARKPHGTISRKPTPTNLPIASPEPTITPQIPTPTFIPISDDQRANMEDDLLSLQNEPDTGSQKTQLGEFMKSHKLGDIPPDIQDGKSVVNFINWMRATLALCSLKGPVVSDAQAWQAYLVYHRTRYQNEDTLLSALCAPQDWNTLANEFQNIPEGNQESFNLITDQWPPSIQENMSVFYSSSQPQTGRLRAWEEGLNFNLPDKSMLPGSWDLVSELSMQLRIPRIISRGCDYSTSIYLIRYNLMEGVQVYSGLDLRQDKDAATIQTSPVTSNVLNRALQTLSDPVLLLTSEIGSSTQIDTFLVQNIVLWRIMQPGYDPVWLIGLASDDQPQITQPDIQLIFTSDLRTCPLFIDRWTEITKKEEVINEKRGGKK